MKKLILHIGRHKSGTTTLQQFLHTNPELLHSQGLHYPDYGKREFAHHEIGELMSRRNIRTLGEDYLTKIRSCSALLEMEVNTRDETVLISSESFQNCDPTVVQQYFTGYDTTVVVYLREQASYLVSAYAQKVHATNFSDSLEAFYDQIFASDYFHFLEKWRKVFGSRLTVNIFDRKHLAKGDIVYDFCCGVLDIPEKLVAANYEDENANPTLTRKLLTYKIILNKHEIDPVHTRALYRGLAELSKSDDSDRLTLSDKMLAKVLQDCSAGNSKVAERYFERTELFDTSKLTGSPHSQNTITDVEFRDISDQLIELHPKLSSILSQLDLTSST